MHGEKDINDELKNKIEKLFNHKNYNRNHSKLKYKMEGQIFLSMHVGAVCGEFCQPTINN